ncbi:MAG: hypothetical protein GX818_02735 [Tissierellia bacterium]|nr:hypothetical protein [Tissierellia bacterium]
MYITKDGFSYHTFLITMKIKYDEFMNILNKLYLINNDIYTGKIYCTKENIIISEQFRNQGIIIKLKKKKSKPSYISLKVNPRFLIGRYEYEGIFPCNANNISIVQNKIDNILNLIKAEFTFNDMTLSRIDLCVNVDTSDDEITDAYMRLIKRCFIPYNYNRVRFKKDRENYKEKNNNSFSAYSPMITFSIYDKNYQMHDQNLPKSIEYKDSEILRIEVTLKRDAIYQIVSSASDNALDNNEVLSFFGKKSKEIILANVHKFFQIGNYAPFKDAKLIIQNSNYRKSDKKHMLYLLTMNSKCKNMNTAVKKTMNEHNLSTYQVNNIIDKFDALNVNPITLTNNQSHIKMLPSIYDLLNQ